MIETIVRRCVYCTDGCSECGGTGVRHTTSMTVGASNVRFHGDCAPSPRSEEAIRSVISAALVRLRETSA